MSSLPDAPIDAIAEPKLSPMQMFIAFSALSLSGFGGVMPFAYRALVERRAWLSGAEFAALVGVAQVLPGPTICNMAVMVGMRKSGRIGGATALLGMVAGPMVIVLLLGVLYQRIGTAAPVQAALHGMSAVAAGLIFATAVKMGRSVFIDAKSTTLRRLVMLLLCVLAFAGVGLMRWNLAIVVAILAPIAVAFEMWARND